jgi:2-keto-4-pentenoate hydratase/2-oxohepta-3-ene-1,7-dioic acid hydratase in catechol pathway
MQLCSYRAPDGERVGLVRDGRVTAAAEIGGPQTTGDLLRGGLPALAALRDAADASAEAAGTSADGADPSFGGAVALESLELLAPVPRPGKVIAIGLNYRAHAEEQGTELPKEPLIFAKFPTSVVGHRSAIRWDPALTAKVDYEAELAVVIGRTARQVPASEALGYVLGYTCGNDVSARDLQFGDRQWVRGKSLDTFCPLGPLLVTADELPDPQVLAIRCVVNGETLQESTTGDMIFGVAELVAHCSRAFTLEPGDVIMTGTPSGVGVYRDPPRFLADGDEVAIEIEGIGRLLNVCRTEPQEGHPEPSPARAT